MELIEIVHKLVGDYHAIGEFYHDNEAQENLEVYCELADHIIFNLIDEAKLVKCYEASRESSGRLAMNELKDIKEAIDDFLEDYEDKEKLK